MSNMEKIIKNETVEDVLLAFTPNTAYQGTDRMYVKYRFDVVANRELLFTYQRLIKEGKLAEDDKGHTLKGPIWKEPKFLTDKKYDAE